jgi:hypothetical protein
VPSAVYAAGCWRRAESAGAGEAGQDARLVSTMLFVI